MADELAIATEFQVEKISGNFTRMVTFIEETHITRMVAGTERIYTTRKLVPKVDEFTEAYMIYYPQGHSLMIAADDEEQLVRLGVLRDPKRVDMNSGVEIPDDYALTPKEIVQRKENNRPRARSSQGGIAAAMEG